MRTRLNHRWLIIVVAVAIFAGGCQRTIQMLSPDPEPMRTTADLEFQAGADRRPTARTLYAMARILAAKGQDYQCQIVLRRIIDEYPDYMPAYCNLAELQMRHGHVGATIKTLSAGLKRDASDSVLLNNMGMCHLQQGDHPRALGYFTQAAGVNSDSVRFRANMAAALGLLGRYDESFALYEQILPPSEAHNNLGILCRARNDRARAEEQFSLAAALSPAQPKAE